MIEEGVNIALVLIRKFEGCRLRPYLCPAGVPTIGYGSTRYADGRAVQLMDPAITHQEAVDLLLFWVKNKYLPQVIRYCATLDTAERLGAILDFTYNLGPGNLRVSTLRQKILEELWEEVPPQLRRWNKAGGRVLRGLTLRREAEAALI